MKNTIKQLLVILVIGTLLSFQTINWFRYAFYFNGGIKVGNVPSTGTNKTGSKLILIDSITTDNTTTPTGYAVIGHAGDTLNPIFSNAGYVDLGTVFVKLLITDTLHVTTGRNLLLTDAGKWISATNATESRIRIPADTTVNFPIGTVINVSMDGTGLVHFIKGTGVIFQSEKDSVCINTQYGVATLVKRAVNKWRLFGSITD